MDTSQLKLSQSDTITLTLRVFPVNFEKPYTLLDSNKVFSEELAIPIEEDFRFKDNDRENLFKKGLKYNGSFSRGISVGNSQSLVLDANLNLSIKGDLGNGLAIEAVISDDQIPIQPEGNTQILQEFDKVFIKISKDKTNLIAGDYNLNSMPFKYANYQKKMKGIMLSHTIPDIGGAQLKSTASFAISKGKFVREQLQTAEGNQGPYKLRSNTTSNYLIIIAGSEKVYMDGQLLKRGESLDYTIDYNRAEIFFTVKNIINADKRIFVEYEYRDQSYLRSMYALQNEIKVGKATFKVDFFREADSKSIANNEEIDSLDLSILMDAGDNLFQSVRSGINPVESEIDPTREYYNKTYNNLSTDSILVYTDEPDQNSYTASFSDVGDSNGSYIIDQEAIANGRVYKYVGIGQGSYEPIKQLIPPHKKQMLSLGANFDLPKNTKINSEISLSDFDDNRFSSIDNGNNRGVAGQFGINKTIYLDTSKTKIVQTGFNSSYVNKNFNSINPFRSVEYNRDWNISDEVSRANEYNNVFNISLNKKGNYLLSYLINSFVSEDIYNGLKQGLQFNLDNKKIGMKSNVSYLTASENSTKTTFFRPNVDFYYNIHPTIRLGTTFEHEGLLAKEEDSNLLLSTSLAFEKYGVYISTIDHKFMDLQLIASRRNDHRLRAGKMEDAYSSDDIKLNGRWVPNKKSILNFDIGYRNLRVEDPSLTTNESSRHIISNTQYDFNGYEKAVRTTSSYRIGIGQEPKLEFTFEKVQAGEGNYGWIDYNDDGKEQIDEFIISNFQDTANYVKIPVFNNQYVSTNTIEFLQSIRLDPSLYLKNSENYKWLKKWSSNSTIRYQQKQNLSESNAVIPFFQFDIADTTVFSHSGSIQNTLFYNRGNPSHDIQLGQSSLSRKLAQVTGYEVNKNDTYYIRSRFNVWNSTDFINKYAFGKRKRVSEKFENRDYKIESHLITSTVSYRPNTTLRINLTGEYDIRNNIDNIKALSKKLNLNINYKIAKKSSVITEIKYVNVDYNGEANTPLHTVMLDGLNTGNNFLWTLQYNQQIRKNLFLTLRYNGRKTGEVNTVHTANAQLKASF